MTLFQKGRVGFLPIKLELCEADAELVVGMSRHVALPAGQAVVEVDVVAVASVARGLSEGEKGGFKPGRIDMHRQRRGRPPGHDVVRGPPRRIERRLLPEVDMVRNQPLDQVAEFMEIPPDHKPAAEAQVWGLVAGCDVRKNADIPIGPLGRERCVDNPAAEGEQLRTLSRMGKANNSVEFLAEADVVEWLAVLLLKRLQEIGLVIDCEQVVVDRQPVAAAQLAAEVYLTGVEPGQWLSLDPGRSEEGCDRQRGKQHHERRQLQHYLYPEERAHGSGSATGRSRITAVDGKTRNSSIDGDC